jgi:single-stranded-DNA-specific exonuclease
MGKKYSSWINLSGQTLVSLDQLPSLICQNRDFLPIDQLEYGDYGIQAAAASLAQALKSHKKIGLYADYDVDGTMSCVSWIWFLQALGYHDFVYHIPCRFSEGYGLNLPAVQKLIHEQGVDVIITMDTGITANQEAAYAKSQGVQFICTDHHKIQPEKMPDCIIVNPKLHPDPQYQELCGCGVTFVLLRAVARLMGAPLASLWNDLLALCGMATICDVVPLGGVNHKLAKLGVAALTKSSRPILRALVKEARDENKELDESDIGFRVGPRINAVGRLDHADQVIAAFVHDHPHELVRKMGEVNTRRKQIQDTIVRDAMQRVARHHDDPVIFLGDPEWHAGVIGIVASKIVEHTWKPTWLFQIKDGVSKGSARSIEGFDITDAMAQSASLLFSKFGGHSGAAGFSFESGYEEEIRRALIDYALTLRTSRPEIWQSKIKYDCELTITTLNNRIIDILDSLKPFGHGFEQPLFKLSSEVEQVAHYRQKHTAVFLKGGHKVMFFNEILTDLAPGSQAQFLVSCSRSNFQGRVGLQLFGKDYQL